MTYHDLSVNAVSISAVFMRYSRSLLCFNVIFNKESPWNIPVREMVLGSNDSTKMFLLCQLNKMTMNDNHDDDDDDDDELAEIK